MRGNELFKRIGDCAVSGVVRNRAMRKNVGNFQVNDEIQDCNLIHEEEKIKSSTSKRMFGIKVERGINKGRPRKTNVACSSIYIRTVLWNGFRTGRRNNPSSIPDRGRRVFFFFFFLSSRPFPASYPSANDIRQHSSTYIHTHTHTHTAGCMCFGLAPRDRGD